MKKNIFYKHYLTLVTLLPFLSGCSLNYKKNFVQKVVFTNEAMRHKNECTPQEMKKAAQEPIITVWIHGTKGTYYSFKRITSIARFFYTLDGIQPLEVLDPVMHHRKIGETLIASDPQQFMRGHVYMFGWSGQLNFPAREQAAHELRFGLDCLLRNYKERYNCTPKIRLITHSHGGNVALNLAAIKDDYPTPIEIDQLILLACPIQDHTEYLAQDDMFKRVYSLYSNKDFIQILDPQGAYKDQKQKVRSFLSRRRFSANEKVRQARIKINKRPLSHIEFMMTRFIDLIPTIIAEIDSWEKLTPANCNTEHILALYTHNYKHPSRVKCF